MSRFADALAAHPAPAALGDVSLRYEPSMLIGETPKPRRSLRPVAAWLGGVIALLAAGGVLLARGSEALIAGLALIGALLLAGGVWLERLERRRRGFVANFATTSLRLDFVTPVAGHARTLIVPFDAVRGVQQLTQADGAKCLIVEFVHEGQRLQEVLVAHITAGQGVEAERLERVLRGAFGLGEAPADSPAFDPEASSFG